jgi:hypothetical protein
MRVPPVILRSTRQLLARLEVIADRRLFNRDALRVAIIAAENATDEALLSYLEPEPELTQCE